MTFKTWLFLSIWCHFTFITWEEFELALLILEKQLRCWSDVQRGQIVKCKKEQGKHAWVCGLRKFLQVTKETNASSNHQIRMSEHIILLFPYWLHITVSVKKLLSLCQLRDPLSISSTGMDLRHCGLELGKMQHISRHSSQLIQGESWHKLHLKEKIGWSSCLGSKSKG